MMNSDLLNEIKKLNSTKTYNENPNKIMFKAKSNKLAQIIQSNHLDQQKLQIMNSKNKNLFNGYTFVFPAQDVALSNKLIKILKEEIKNNNGTVIELGEKITNKIHYYLVSEKITRQKLKKIIKEEGFEDKVLNFQYVKDCIRQNQIMDIDMYRIIKDVKPSELKKQQKKNQIGQKIQQQISKQQQIQKQVKKTKKQSQQDQQLLWKKMKTNNGKIKKISIMGQEQDQISVDSEEVHTIQVFNINHQKRKKNSELWDTKKQHFICQKGSGLQNNLNEFIIDQLTKLKDIYQTQKDVGRKIAYQKAISTIKSLDIQIKSAQDIEELPRIGTKIKNKIIEIVQTGKLKKLEVFQKQQKYTIKNQLSRVWGIGAATADSLFRKGIKTIQQLRQHQEYLNKNQKIGLKYLEQFEMRIPRAQVQQIEDIVKKQIYVSIKDKDIYQIQTCGSYRRGKQTCGDIDIIITRKDGVFQEKFLCNLIQRLQKIGLITDNLSMPRIGIDHESFSYMGVCRLTSQSPHRRLDLKYYRLEQYAFALLYFTGSDMFNRSMRLFARRKGYSLSDHGLYPVIRDQKSNNKAWQGKTVACFSQKQIFDYLGLDYKSPSERNI